MKNTFSLAVMILVTWLGYGQTYTAVSIPYTPYIYTTGTQINTSIYDDWWFGPVNIGFPFCFYGKYYSTLNVGTNGNLSFSSGLANTNDSWRIPTPWPDSLAPDMRNTINPALRDWFQFASGNIYYRTEGTAPNRHFIVAWYNTAIFNDTTVSPSSFEAVLYESSNFIEFHLGQVSANTSWNNGRGVCGLMDSTGTDYTIVPGRNATAWTASNDGWRFTPSPLLLPM